MPSPQRARVQSVRHVPSGASELAAPSSHCSPAEVTPSPQKVQLFRQESLLFELPSSHASAACFWPSPQ